LSNCDCWQATFNMGWPDAPPITTCQTISTSSKITSDPIGSTRRKSQQTGDPSRPEVGGVALPQSYDGVPPNIPPLVPIEYYVRLHYYYYIITTLLLLILIRLLLCYYVRLKYISIHIRLHVYIQNQIDWHLNS